MQQTNKHNINHPVNIHRSIYNATLPRTPPSLPPSNRSRIERHGGDYANEAFQIESIHEQHATLED